VGSRLPCQNALKAFYDLRRKLLHFFENLKERDYFEGQGLDGKIILKYILEE
jgi:hypothetical protein